jgi:uncharacterized protein (TIGR02453 family)
MQPRFTPRTLSFLRALKRNNRREWFNPRKEQFERDVRAPMVAVVEQLAKDFKKFAPELEASPKTSIFRIYRDTRFSEDKSPYKTQVAAAFRVKALPKGQSAGMYVEVTPGWVWMGGGYYAPETPQLVKIRGHISETFPEIRRLTHAATFRRLFGAIDGEQLARVPRGFDKDDPSADYLRYRSFLVGREFPPEFATRPAFYATLVETFKAGMPLVRFLTEPLIQRGGRV